jgi:hypothetical protein
MFRRMVFRPSLSRPQQLLEGEKSVVAVLLVPMLRELTELTKRLDTLIALVREIMHSSVSSHSTRGGGITHERTHRLWTIRKVVDLPPSIVLASTAATEAALDVLSGIRPKPASCIAANGAGNTTGTMNLQVHVKILLAAEIASANFADEVRRMAVTAVPPATQSRQRALSPFAGRHWKIRDVTIVSTFSTVATHDFTYVSNNDLLSGQQRRPDLGSRAVRRRQTVRVSHGDCQRCLSATHMKILTDSTG